MIRVRGAFVLIVFAACTLAAGAQSESQLREGELSIDIDVRFISTYRDGSWVPVDVIVNNNQRDIEGYIELITKQAGVVQPPAYRVPVDSPKGSRKRFRLYCLLDGTTDLEAMLYRGRRPALDGPMKISLRPIGKNDYLSLILDNEPADYGFLYNAVLDGSSVQGFYRVELRGDELGALPDRLPCYEPIDMIVMGDINPADISQRHRALIKRYIENGGTLVVCTGENTPLYRGTWVEELLGVTLGSQQVVTEQDFAQVALTSLSDDRLRADKQGEFTPLTPSVDGVMRWGGGEALAAIRPIGNGFAAVVSLDMAGKLLHTTKEYEMLWTQLADLHTAKSDVNIDVTSSFLRDQLPNVAGVRVFPRSSVATYLTLYLLVAIVGNWVFWSFMKRREMAWVCLVFFSTAFTLYAMIYGTAGRAKETELEQVNIVRVYNHTPVAKVHSTVGLLSARSANYSFGLADEMGLVSQGARAFSAMYMGMPQQSNRREAGSFAFVESSQPRVENLRVGASVMRTLQIQSELTLPGGVEGTLTHDGEGLRGSITNRTGLRIQDPWIYYMGYTVRAKSKPGTDLIEVKVPANQLDSSRRLALDQNASWPYYGAFDYQVQSVQNAIREPLTSMIFLSPDNNATFDTSLGPYLFGWASESPSSPVNFEEDVKFNIRETLVVADLRVESSALSAVATPLSVEVNGAPSGTLRGPYQQYWYDRSDRLSWQPGSAPAQRQQPVVIDLPRGIAANAVGAMTIVLNWTTEPGFVVRFAPENAQADWSDAHAETKTPGTEESFGVSVNVMRFHVEDWRTYYDESAGVLRATVALMPESQAARAQAGWAQFTVRAHLEVSPQRTISKEWKAWP